MLRDVFYFGSKPNIHPREQKANDLAHAKSLSTTEHFWIINEYCDYKGFDWDFDFAFLPDEDVWAEEHYNVWPSQHQKDSGTWLCNTDNNQPLIVYRADVDVVKRKNIKTEHWVESDLIDSTKFDFSWHPDPTDPPFIYQFGTQWQSTGGPKYVVPGATEIKFVEGYLAIAIPQYEYWITPNDIDSNSFDYSWHPHSDDPPFIYQFGTQWQKTDGPKYIAKDAEEGISPIKYIDTYILKAKRLPSHTNWTIPEEFDSSKFDFSWHPDSTAPPQIYQWVNNGPRYTVDGADKSAVILMEKMVEADIEISRDTVAHYFIETTLEDLINKHPNEVFWALNPDLLYDEFNFDWRPEVDKERYVNVFGNEDNKDIQTYFVNAPAYMLGYKEYYYVENVKIKVKSNLTMFFVDKGNEKSNHHFEKLKARFPNIQKTRYLNSWIDTINRCINRSVTNLCWILNSELDYDNFDFNYYPNPWQMKMVHVFGTQWSHWGTTFMVNRDNFAEDTKYIKLIEHLSCLNFVKERRAIATNRLYDVAYIDHGNGVMFEAGSTVIKYEESYLATFKKLLLQLPEKKEHYIWVCSSICDYQDFDFTYICDPFTREQLHVFPSDRQKFGDTFLINVNKLRELIANMEQLEDYTKINYNQHQRVKRLPAPTIITEGDTHVSSINVDYNFPYAEYVTSDNKDIQRTDTEPMSLWSQEHKKIIVTSAGGTRIIAPKEVKNHVKRELYDYPYIITNSKLAQSKPLDIVFLSNGEKGADENYEHLLKVTKGLSNRVIRVDGVNGRVAAYHAAAEASNTPWMFTVFAKLRVNNKFDWSWQPDRLQLPKHYIFHATNPVNGLEYGHQAMIAYNKKITLSNNGTGLDFTLDNEHEVVEINSGVAMYNTDAWSTWRTAFREALKLKADDSHASKNRLESWLNIGTGEFAEYSMEGAQHAVEYYESVSGDFEKLKLSYDWPWLRAYFNNKYNL